MLKIKEEWKNVLSKLEDVEYQKLEESILEIGCVDPIIVYEGYIVDGHNRYEICTRHNIKYQTFDLGNVIEIDGDEDIVDFIKEFQMGRRNIPVYVKALQAIEYEKELVEEGKAKSIANLKKGGEIPDVDGSTTSGRSRNKAAEKAGISVDTLKKVKKIEQLGTTEQKRDLVVGTKSVNEVHKEVNKVAQLRLSGDQMDEKAAKFEAGAIIGILNEKGYSVIKQRIEGKLLYICLELQ